MLDLTPVIAAEMLIARLELNDEADDPVLQYNDDENGGWKNLLKLDTLIYDWDMREVANLAAGKPFFRFRIIDDQSETLSNSLRQAEVIKYDGWRYKVSRESEPFGANRVWVLRLDRTERAIETSGYGFGYGLAYGGGGE